MSMANQTIKESAIQREYLSAKEVESIYGISNKTLFRWKDKRIVSHTKLVGRVLFFRSELDEMVRTKTVFAIGKQENEYGRL